jgi:Spy/CpxP family protein refolding chaperone
MRDGLLIMMAGILLLMAVASFAELDREERRKVDELAATLQLTPKQKTAVLAERKRSRNQLMTLEKKWQKLHDRLRSEVRSEIPDQSRVDSLAEAIGKVRGEIIALRTRSLIHLKSLLTPQQIKILEGGKVNDGKAGSNE